MDLPTLFLGTMMTILSVIGAGLLAAMVLLERGSKELSAAAGGGTGAQSPLRTRRPRPTAGRRRRA